MVMEQYLIHDTTLTDIADALRRKHGDTKTIIVEEATPIIKISKTSNATGFDTFEGGYGNGIDTYEVITIPGAKSIKIDIGYQTENVNYDYVQVAAGSWPIAIPNNIGKLGGSTLSKLSLEHPNTDTITIHFYSNTSNDNYLGYYAEIRGLDANGNFITEIVDKEKEVPNTYNPLDMADAIDDIDIYIPPIVEALVVTENGTYTPSEGVDGFNPVTVEVPTGGGDLPDEAFVVKGICNYRFGNGGWDWFINNYGSQITTEDISSANNMFYASKVEEIPFELNFTIATSGYHSGTQLFYDCNRLKSLPKINKFKPNETKNIFYGCYRLREIPADWADNINWSYITEQTSGYNGDMGGMFKNCYSLRSFPMDLLIYTNPYINYSYSIYNGNFYYCYTLDEIVNLPVAGDKTSWTSNAFRNTFDCCWRLKRLTFGFDNKPDWKSQTIDLSKYVGYVQGSTYESYVLNYNSGITADKKVTDDATYQALKDDPDWYTLDIAYSRYNHDSAVETINSLPDTSAYLAEKGGTNTIKFKGASGSATDGGAINTLTAEEIAVAAAKGWTVTLS